jgi:DNA (cytosine-5)-methyltransferase 1
MGGGELCRIPPPRAIIIENVPEFQDWKLFPSWKSAMQALGYAMSVNVLDAADAGIPQHRLRLFIVCTRSLFPIQIPNPTHRHVPASSIIDWSGGSWSKVDKPGRAKATLERIRDGRGRGWDRFLISYYGNTKTARSIDRPIGTITTRDRWAVVDGDRMRMLTPAECRRAMGFREDYILPTRGRLAVHMLGNAVPPPLAAHVISEVRRAA